MPVLPCYYQPPPGFANGHLQTIFPTLFRREVALRQERVLIPGVDQGFLDLDLSYAEPGRQGRRAVIVSHGLEGDSRRKYVKGMCRVFNASGVDAIAWNQPGCGGRACTRPRIYHMGETRDLACVVDYALARGYESLALVGFSMGGNQMLNYAAGPGLPPQIKAVAAFSVPCDLPEAVKVLNRRGNFLYMGYFMRSLRPKIRDMNRKFPGLFNIQGLSKIFTFTEFDKRFTAPLNGFTSAEDYYAKASSLPRLGELEVPTLLVNAADDPFLSASCYPYAAAERNPRLFLKVPESGGHVGYVTFNRANCYWSEQTAHDFVLKRL